MTGSANDRGQDLDKVMRTRSLQACIPCHRSKRKCNRRKPCSECLKRQRTSECAYEALGSDAISTLNDSQTSVESENQILHARIIELEDVLSSLRKQQKDDGRSGQKRRRITENVTTDDDVYYGRSFYLGGPSAPNLLQRMIALTPNNSSDLLFAFFGGTDGQTITGDRDILGQHFPAHYGVSDMLIFIRAVDKGLLDQQLDSYFELVDPLHHYLPTPWIVQRYEQCFATDSLSSPQELALIFAIIGLGDLVSSNKSSWQLISGSLHLLRLSKFLTSPSLDAVATFSYIAVYLQHEGRLNEYWPLLGMVIRIAQSLGLHRDPRWIKNLSQEESEVRRRVFHTVAAQETALSIMFGRPTGLGYFDTDLPEDVSDDHLFGDETSRSSYPFEISYNRCTFQLMDISRAVAQDCATDTRHTDLSKAENGRTRILQWYESLPMALKYTGSATNLQELAEQNGRAGFVQSLVIYMIVNHSILILFRKPLLGTSSPDAAEPCFRAAIAVSEAWKVLQDSFPKMASITFMHWFRAFHASLICLIAIRATNTKEHIRGQAVTAWNSCKRIFLRLESQNESMRCCSRALDRLDQVLKTDLNIKRRKSVSSTRKMTADSSSSLRIPPVPGSEAGFAAEVDDMDSTAVVPLPPTPDLEALAALSAVSGESLGLTTGQELTSDAHHDMNYGQIFDSFMMQPDLADGGEQQNVAVQTNIFDMDANNWPTWLINDRSSSDFFDT